MYMMRLLHHCKRVCPSVGLLVVCNTFVKIAKSVRKSLFSDALVASVLEGNIVHPFVHLLVHPLVHPYVSLSMGQPVDPL